MTAFVAFVEFFKVRLPVVVAPVPEVIAPFVEVIPPLAVSVVNAPVLAVVEPIPCGTAHVLPSNVLALIVPVPLKFNEAPVPTTIAAVVFVPLVMFVNGTVIAGVLDQLGVAPAPVRNQHLTSRTVDTLHLERSISSRHVDRTLEG